MKRFIFIFLICIFAACRAGAEEVLDAVVAEVDGEPITFSDVAKELPATLNLTYKDINKPIFKLALDKIITRHLIENEAKKHRLSVNPREVNKYLNEIITTNGITEEELKNILKKEGKTLEQYRKDLRMEILKGKLAAVLFNDLMVVTEEEVENYIKENIEPNNASVKLKLRSIYLSGDKYTEEEQAKKTYNEIYEQYKNGASFIALVNKYSDSPNKSSGGLIGIVSEHELNPNVFEAVFSLKEGEISKLVKARDGYRVFFVEKRFKAQDKDLKKIKEEVREKLRKQKVIEEMKKFFTTQLFKGHSIEKFI